MFLAMEFEKLTTTEKGRYIFTRGKYISERVYYNYHVILYLVQYSKDIHKDDEFFELYFVPNENMIEKIEKVDDLDTLDLYIKEEMYRKAFQSN